MVEKLGVVVIEGLVEVVMDVARLAVAADHRKVMMGR